MHALRVDTGPAQDEERTVHRMFEELDTMFARLDALNQKALRAAKLRELALKLNETKTAIRQWEAAAKVALMDADSIAATKKRMVAEVNAYIQRKRDAEQETSVRQTALQQAAKAEPTQADMTVQQLMSKGTKATKEIEASLDRSERMVHQTIELGTKTAEQLQSQTQQLERVVDTLDEMAFTLKKAQRVLRDMTRALATDKCILSLMLLVVMGVIAAIVVRIVRAPGKSVPRVQDVLAGNATRRL